MRRKCSLLNSMSKCQRSRSLDIKVAIWFSLKILEQSCEIEMIIFLCIWIGIICMHILKDINMWIKCSVLRLKKCKYETPCVDYDTQVTVKACGPPVQRATVLQLNCGYILHWIIIILIVKNFEQSCEIEMIIFLCIWIGIICIYWKILTC